MPETSRPEAERHRRFVILFHAHPTEGDHYDLMIEDGASLATWRIEQSPDSLAAGQSIACQPIGDHRLAYLEYEGPVSGDRGHVTRHDAGNCTMSDRSSSPTRLLFDGGRLKGRFVMERVESTPDQWRLRLD